MKITNETKIGALTSVSIVLLILGFNFLKGKDLFEHSKKIYAVFKSVEGLELSNSVSIQGLQVGTVYGIQATNKDLDGILVTISMKKDVNIPKNSVAYISAGLINSSNIIIQKGDVTDFIQDGDTLQTITKGNILADMQGSLNPVMRTLTSTLGSLDSLIQIVGSLFNPGVKNNFTSIIGNLARSSASLQVLLNDRNSSLSRTMVHLDSFTNNLASNNQRITGTLDNLEKTTGKLANAKIDETLQSAQTAMNSLKEAISKINSRDGTMGLLLNDKKLYLNLENTTRSLNILLDDLRLHPKRYVNVSVFGKKDKSAPLTAPLNDTTANRSKPN
ncbi:MAG TPA: mammalian cell entry protein [Chitinophagaceae bacterium]|jgi:phospholipid/cholesterol/gamma-HCH transport system substrate-binding protein|nr:mammalian cell entry protein [Chitinophagaceae bacterium]